MSELLSGVLFGEILGLGRRVSNELSEATYREIAVFNNEIAYVVEQNNANLDLGRFELEVSDFVYVEGIGYRYEKLSFDGRTVVALISNGERKVVGLENSFDRNEVISSELLNAYADGNLDVGAEDVEFFDFTLLRREILNHLYDLHVAYTESV